MAKINIKPRVRVPRSVKKGDVFEVKTLVFHKMESGQRVNKKTAKKIPRNILNRFVVTYNGKEVLDAVWQPGLSANPYMAFFLVAEESGPLVFTWTDDNKETYKKQVMLKVQ
ncbi:MAG: thiosulfate oxidation carrier complex protein SoxZ [Rhodospirillaceae bacterium]|jgi:sulfur-oxidizing protein SoxZ|nr:thiosulfate oxidation carrier complex protein SoxZ [Rhodospirillaceae bacterium]MBT5940131.1 thiosulfate oxidation carrier complex protein SoxZ [Rhodospirillaceae bacterium]MBT7265638.1 thiosulfate oxidation carrier complex protein SoxZ [Rhodospirillaceae bacterium]